MKPPSFKDAIEGEKPVLIPLHERMKEVKRVQQKRLNIQAQKYALVPMWRRRRGGKTGQKK